ncbi:MAG TPA: hypothetical protein VFV38_40050 [Ktedonobacteraceae bacterium]|nr:hypothetical protein [Ktedonobacteraceae bacterium]
MQQSADQPCNSLAECRQKVEEIEMRLELTAPHTFTVPILEIYMSIILAALSALRMQATIGETVQSRDAVRAYMRQARDDLSRAIVERCKGVTNAYVKHLTACQQSLEQALKYW